MIGTDFLAATERDRILRAMADCCAERGFAETSIESVVERAGVRREDFDAHFADLEDCALGAMNKVISEALTALSTASARQAEAEGIGSQVRAIVDLVTAEPSFARLASIESRQVGTGPMRDAYESAIRVLSVMLERVDSGSGPRPSGCARAALGGAEALVRRELSSGNPERLRRYLADFAYTALVPFVGQAEALRQARLVADSATEEG